MSMSETCATYQKSCLYFTANSLSRYINNIADECFSHLGIPISYAHLMLQLIEEPGLSQNELSRRMNLKASTMTRFVDKLIEKGYVERIQNGKFSEVYPTEKGVSLKSEIRVALEELYKRYCEKLGEDFAIELTEMIHRANTVLDG